MKATFLILAVVALAGCGTTTINNPIVEEAIRVRSPLGHHFRPFRGELTKADLEKVTSLYLMYKQLTEIPKGLENLTQLTELFLHDNQLTDVKGLEKLTSLEHLVLDRNQLTDAEGLEKLTQLVVLWIRKNKLTDVKGLEKLTQLESLHLDGNNLTDVKGLEKLTNLGMLSLVSNQLTDVKGLEKLTSLEYLDLRGNPDLTKAQISKLRKALPKCYISSRGEAPVPFRRGIDF